MKKILITFIIGLIFSSCTKRGDYEAIFANPELYSKTVGLLTDVITHDIFTPPVASRIYAYSNLAAYEIMTTKSKQYKSLSSKLKGFDSIELPDKPINTEFSSLLAFLYVGQELTFSKDSTQKIIDNYLELAKSHKMPSELIDDSEKYARKVSNAVLAWSKKDNYKESRSAVKYTVNDNEGRWVPTPPAYMAAVEPKWREIRTVLIDSASQFLPQPPTKFSKDKNSDFYKLALEVYEIGMNPTEEQKAMADFWDCNGFKVNVSGHVMFATKAMTPGGHWMGITGIVSHNNKADFEKTVFAYSGVSFAIMDGFIACWNTKFTYDLIRPETYINLYIDNKWGPYLQTPPFPEYSSAHSTISNASASILTNIFGDNTAFIDNTERRWGWPDRKFESVKQAAQEAGHSRMYGGIHYREAFEQGLLEGEKIGEYVFSKLK